jgi:hypothetical protein
VIAFGVGKLELVGVSRRSMILISWLLIRLMAFPFNKSRYLLVRLTVALVNH